nr:integrase [Paeniclostridium ghonii]
MKILQEIKNNQQSKYDEIIEYLSQDNGYWLENDKWDLTETFFIGKRQRHYRYLDFSTFENVYIKNEVKYYLIYSYKNKFLKASLIGEIGYTLKRLGTFLENESTLLNFDKDKLMNKWKFYLINNQIKLNSRYYNFLSSLLVFIKEFYDDREETEKDIWYAKNIQGVKFSASSGKAGNKCLNFTFIPEYYKELVKKYFRTIITKKSFSHCYNILTYLNYFFNSFYSRKYTDGFLENLSREDIEKYIVILIGERNKKSKEETNKY